MAEVFLVRSVGAAGIEKRLVLKCVLPTYSSHPKFTAMFIDEARVAVTLNHPNIVQVYDFGRYNDDYYLAMEFVEGVDLARLLSLLVGRGGTLPVGDAIFVVQEVLKGLDYAHRKRDGDGEPLNIVHRDVSPQNVLISREGSVKITDFGIAQSLFAEDDGEGVIKGKFAYMAPEQARGGAVDVRTDVFAAGIILWEALCHRSLFNERQKLSKGGLDQVHLQAAPAIRELIPELPPALEAICAKSLSLEPEDRYPSAREMSSALSHYLLSLEEVHDAFTLADQMVQVEEVASSSDETSTEPAPPETSDPVRTVAMGRPESLSSSSSTTVAFDPSQVEGRARRTITEQKEVVCVYGEISGFAELRQATSQDRFRAVLMDYLSMLDGIAFKGDASVGRVSEIGFSMIVGLPLSRETDAERACSLAKDIIEATEGVNRNLSSPIALSIGIYRRGCTLRRVEGTQGFEHDLDPSLERIARRLAEEAQPGEILVGGGAYRLARRGFRFEEVEAIPMELPEEATSVVSGRLKAFSLMGPMGRAERAAAARTTYGRLSGRDLELRALDSAFERVALHRSGRLFCLFGEAGSGKTALVETFVSRHVGEARVLRAEAGILEDAPYGLLIDFLGDLLEISASEPMRDVKRKLEQTIAAFGPGLREQEALYLRHSLGALLQIKYRDSLVENMDPEARKARTFLSLRRILGHLGSQQATVVVFDGVEKCDPASLEFLQTLIDDGVPPRLLLLLLARPGLGERRTLRPKSAQRIELSELSERARRELVRDWLGERTDAGLIARTVASRAGGNPLFLLETLGVLSDQNLWDQARDSDAELPVPTSVEGLVAARLDALQLDDRHLAMAAAQLERPITPDLLELVHPELSDPAEAIQRLVSLGLLVTLGQTGSHRFKHPILREIAAAALPEDEAADLHGRIAAHLRSLKEAGRVVGDGEIAHHLRLAGELETAAAHYLKLGLQSYRQGSTAQAIKVLKQACELLPSDSPDHLLAADMLEKSWERSGQEEGRLEVVERYRAAAEACNDAYALCESFNRLGRVHLDRLEVDEAEQILQQGLALSREHGQPGCEGKARVYLGYVARNRGDYRAAEAHCRDALAIFDAQGLDEDLAATWTFLGIVLRQTGRPAEALLAYLRSLDTQKQSKNETVREATLTNLALAENSLGDHFAALQWIKRALRLNRDIGNRRRRGLILGNLGEIYLNLGRPDRAIHCVRQAVRLARASRNVLHEGVALVSQAHTAMDFGDLAESAKLLDTANQLAESAGNAYLTVDVLLAQSALALLHEDGAAASRFAQGAALQARMSDLAHAEALSHARNAQGLQLEGRLEAAELAAQQALTRLPNHSPAVECQVRFALYCVNPDSGREHLIAAQESIRSRAAKIPDESLRHAFLQRPLHQKIIQSSPKLSSDEA